jgi:hypothetical protein
MSPPSARAELAAAVRAVNAAYARLPHSAQANIQIAYDGIEAEIDSSILAGDQERARDAIRAWREYWLGRFAGRSQGATR